MSIFTTKPFASLKTHRERLTTLYDVLHKNTLAFTGAALRPVSNNLVRVTLGQSQTDLKRYLELAATRQYLFDTNTKQVIKLNSVPAEAAGGLLAESEEPQSGNRVVRFRKGQTNDKDVFVEVWDSNGGFVSSLKVTDKLKSVYNDTLFGGIAWSRDMTKIVFIGEKPDIAAYTPFFKDSEEPKPEKKEEEKKQDGEKKEEKKEEHWQDEKFLYQENFGETCVAKKRPAIFVFDLDLNKLSTVEFGKHLAETMYPQKPVFDGDSKGIIFSCIDAPIKKLGLNYCLNRPTNLMYVEDPVFKKEDADKAESYLTNLYPGGYMAMHPKFSQDHSVLAFIGSDNKFLSHSGNY